MIKLTNSVLVKTTPKTAWGLISDFEDAWSDANPYPQEILILAKPKRLIHHDFAWWQRGKIGLATVEFIAKVHDVTKEKTFSWSTVANYQVWRITFKVEQGGTFLIEDAEEGIYLRHDLWGKIEGGLKGSIMEWIAVHLLGQKKAISDQNLGELLYFKLRLEKSKD